ncbi:MAG: hypothetical protein HRT47_06390 [Candidatus Caenarcaniphilales bacterium]|nr:hypothetical protein [Candidatus Caenarcaniphilales bacterium]
MSNEYEITSPKIENSDLVILGNDLEALITALAAKREAAERGVNISVTIVTRDKNKSLSNLISNTNQSYLDKDFEAFKDNTIFKEIISKAGLGEDGVSVNQANLQKTIDTIIQEEKIEVIYSPTITVETEKFTDGSEKIIGLGIHHESKDEKYTILSGKQFIDTSADTFIFSSLNSETIESKYIKPAENELLTMSLIPSFNISHSELDQLDFELRKEADPNARIKDSKKSTVIGGAIGQDFTKYIQEKKPDLSQRLGLTNHENGDAYVGAFNLSSPAEGKINFNGFLFRPENMNEAIDFSQGKEPSEDMKELVNEFALYLEEKLGRDIEYSTPKALYVRDTGLSFKTTNPLEFDELLSSDISPNSVASFIYHNDTRGLQNEGLNKYFRNPINQKLEKAEIHTEADVGQHTEISNLYGISEAIGFSPDVQGIGRIQQNMGIGAEIIGTRMGIALAKEIEAEKVSDQEIIQEFKEKRIAPRERIETYQVPTSSPRSQIASL